MKKKKLSSMELMSKSTELKVFGILGVFISMPLAIYLSMGILKSSESIDILWPVVILASSMISMSMISMVGIIRGIMVEIAEQSHARLVEQSHARLVEDMGKMLLSSLDSEKTLLRNLRDELIESLDSHGK